MRQYTFGALLARVAPEAGVFEALDPSSAVTSSQTLPGASSAWRPRPSTTDFAPTTLRLLPSPGSSPLWPSCSHGRGDHDPVPARVPLRCAAGAEVLEPSGQTRRPTGSRTARLCTAASLGPRRPARMAAPRMRAWPSFTCARTPSSPSSTAPCASTTWWPPRQRTARARWRSPTCRTCSAQSSSIRRRARPGSSRSSAPMSGSSPRAARSIRVDCCCWCRRRAGYTNLCTLLSRAWTDPRPRAQAWLNWSWLAECGDGLIALSGADLGAVGQALLARDLPRAAQAARAAPGGAVSAALLHRVAARGRRHQRGARARRRAAGGRTRAAGRRDASGAVPACRRLRSPRGARLRRRGRDACQPAARQALQPGAAFPDAGADGDALRRPAQRVAQQRRDRAPLQPHAGARRAPAAGVSDPARRRRAAQPRSLLPPPVAPGAGASPRTALPRRRAARARACALCASGSTSRSRRS